MAGGDIPPTFKIDLSLPPRARYVELALTFKPQIQNITVLFDDLVKDTLPSVNPSHIHRLARLLLRRLYSDEETEEIRGISEAVDVPMYLMVSLNVLLDLLMGCTSGGIRVREGRGKSKNVRMLHFRTLDWGMDPLRDVLVQLEYVKSKSAQPKKILATSITYVGFVGVLTGVREGLSMSLNFRPVHAAASKIQNFGFYWNHLMVLLGLRKSIASNLRSILLPQSSKTPGTKNQNPDQLEYAYPAITSVLSNLPALHSTAAYLIFSTGYETFILEKDNGSATIRSSKSFIAVTNHDAAHENQSSTSTAPNPAPKPGSASSTTPLNPETIPAVAPTAATTQTSEETTTKPHRNPESPMTLAEAIEESTDRLNCIRSKWEKLASKSQSQSQANAQTASKPDVLEEESLSITKSTLISWLTAYPTTNECTHFGCIMDPGFNISSNTTTTITTGTASTTNDSSKTADHNENENETESEAEAGGKGHITWIRRYATGEVIEGRAGGKVKERLRRERKRKEEAKREGERERWE